MKLVIESGIEKHDPVLYSAIVVTPSIHGFGGVTPESLAEFEEQGYLAIGEAFSAEQVRRAEMELRMMMVADDPQCESIYFESGIREYLGTTGESIRSVIPRLPAIPTEARARLVRKFMGFTDAHPALAEFSRDSDLLNILNQLAGGPVSCFQDMAMIKPPHGQEKPWHQDHAYFNYPIGERIIGVWIALAEVTPEMGCMHVIEGGHRDGPLPHFKRRDWQLCDETVSTMRRTAIHMQAGDALLFDSKLPHGTPTNRTERQRFAIQFHFVPLSAVPTNDESRMEIFGGEGRDVRC